MPVMPSTAHSFLSLTSVSIPSGEIEPFPSAPFISWLICATKKPTASYP